MTGHIDIVFDGPPAPESGRFIEVHDEKGASIRVGEWVELDGGLWALRIPRSETSAPLSKLAAGGLISGVGPLVGERPGPGFGPGPSLGAGAIQIHAVEDPNVTAQRVGDAIRRVREHQAQMRQADRP